MSWTVFEHGNIKDFIRKLDPISRGKISKAITLLKDHGPLVGMPYSKKIDSQLYELRIRGRQEMRILYAIKQDQIILLNAFKKQTQKLPLREIVTALKRLESLT